MLPHGLSFSNFPKLSNVATYSKKLTHAGISDKYSVLEQLTATLETSFNPLAQPFLPTNLSSIHLADLVLGVCKSMPDSTTVSECVNMVTNSLLYLTMNLTEKSIMSWCYIHTEGLLCSIAVHRLNLEKSSILRANKIKHALKLGIIK